MSVNDILPGMTVCLAFAIGQHLKVPFWELMIAALVPVGLFAIGHWETFI